MNELMKVDEYLINGKKEHSVNARELWEFLGISVEFSKWIKRRINDTEAMENQDFVVFAVRGEKGRPTLEYRLTLALAKNISMLEKKKGKLARQYFIECEERYRGQPQTTKQVAQSMQGGSLVAQVRALLEVVERQEVLEAQVVETKQIAQEALEATKTHSGFLTVVSYARQLRVRLDTAKTREIGIALSKYCKEHNIKTYKIDHPVYYEGVNEYPIEVLEKHKCLFLEPIATKGGKT